MQNKVKGMVYAAVIAALYAVITVVPGINLLSYGVVQFRLSEALTVLALFTPWAIPGLTAGCFAANLLSQAGPLDMLFGTAATLLSAIAAWKLRKMPRLIAIIPTVLLNALSVGFMITYFYMPQKEYFVKLFLYNSGSIAVGEATVLVVLGLPLAEYINKNKGKFFNN